MDLLSNKIREHRFKNGEMTQKVLAGRVGISRQSMNAIENCHHAPTISVAIRIADVFQVSVDQMFQLEYAGKPASIEQPARAAVDRSRAPIKEPVSTECRPTPVEEKAQHQLSLADLRGIVDS